MSTHIRILGVLHLVLGGLGLLAGVVFILFFGGLAGVVGSSGESGGFFSGSVLGIIGIAIFLVATVLSLPSLIAGIGLLQFRPWGRILGIILSVLHLFNVPFGTTVGIYGLWALLSPEGEALFRAGRQYGVPQGY